MVTQVQHHEAVQQYHMHLHVILHLQSATDCCVPGWRDSDSQSEKSDMQHPGVTVNAHVVQAHVWGHTKPHRHSLCVLHSASRA